MSKTNAGQKAAPSEAGCACRQLCETPTGYRCPLSLSGAAGPASHTARVHQLDSRPGEARRAWRSVGRIAPRLRPTLPLTPVHQGERFATSHRGAVCPGVPKTQRFEPFGAAHGESNLNAGAAHTARGRHGGSRILCAWVGPAKLHQGITHVTYCSATWLALHVISLTAMPTIV
jgi:hypothetical protein